jgi:hypothetical protein
VVGVEELLFLNQITLVELVVVEEGDKVLVLGAQMELQEQLTLVVVLEVVVKPVELVKQVDPE